MDQIEWCCRQKKGIRIIEPNNNLAEDYAKKSNISLDEMANVKSGEWKIVAAYYACYDILYSLLQKAGIKCEIHECTIALMEFFGFDKNDIKFMKDLKQKRTDAQYYTAAVGLPDEKKVKRFVLKCREMMQKADFDEIRERIIEKIKNTIKTKTHA